MVLILGSSYYLLTSKFRGATNSIVRVGWWFDWVYKVSTLMWFLDGVTSNIYVQWELN